MGGTPAGDRLGHSPTQRTGRGRARTPQSRTVAGASLGGGPEAGTYT